MTAKIYTIIIIVMISKIFDIITRYITKKDMVKRRGLRLWILLTASCQLIAFTSQRTRQNTTLSHPLL